MVRKISSTRPASNRAAFSVGPPSHRTRRTPRRARSRTDFVARPGTWHTSTVGALTRHGAFRRDVDDRRRVVVRVLRGQIAAAGDDRAQRLGGSGRAPRAARPDRAARAPTAGRRAPCPRRAARRRLRRAARRIKCLSVGRADANRRAIQRRPTVDGRDHVDRQIRPVGRGGPRPAVDAGGSDPHASE